MKERDFIERIEAAFPALRREEDAAVYRLRFHEPPEQSDGILTLSTDAVVEGIHFDRRYSTLSQAVQKLVSSNVSDIYAMGGRPEKILFTAGMRKGCTDEETGDIIDGLRKASAFYMINTVGGDTVASGNRFFFNISIVGSQRHSTPIERSGARAGDSLVLFGECGGSLLGMDLLRHMSGMEKASRLPPRIEPDLPSWDELSALLPELELQADGAGIDIPAGRGAVRRHVLGLAKRHLVPEAVPVDAELLGADPPLLNAMIDVSDGIARDIRNLCRASGVGAVIREEALPVPASFPVLLGDEKERWTDYILSSGEEYVMLAACSGEPSPGTVIGEIVHSGEGLTLIGRDGRRRGLPDAGYEHTF